MLTRNLQALLFTQGKSVYQDGKKVIQVPLHRI